MTEKIFCPYCSVSLPEKPTRKKKCPSCGNYILVRSGNLLTQEQADIEDWLKRVEWLGVNKELFEKHYKELAKQFGRKPSVNDTAWRILNNLLLTTPKNSEMIYFEMAQIVKSDGKNPNEYIALANEFRLRSYQKPGVVGGVKVLNCNDSQVCAGCRQLEGKTWTIEDALKNPPIPFSCMNETGCRCTYQPVVDLSLLRQQIKKDIDKT